MILRSNILCQKKKNPMSLWQIAKTATQWLPSKSEVYSLTLNLECACYLCNSHMENVEKRISCEYKTCSLCTFPPSLAILPPLCEQACAGLLDDYKRHVGQTWAEAILDHLASSCPGRWPQLREWAQPKADCLATPSPNCRFKELWAKIKDIILSH